jgi:hypothetical protein
VVNAMLPPLAAASTADVALSLDADLSPQPEKISALEASVRSNRFFMVLLLVGSCLLFVLNFQLSSLSSKVSLCV